MLYVGRQPMQYIYSVKQVCCRSKRKCSVRSTRELPDSTVVLPNRSLEILELYIVSIDYVQDIALLHNVERTATVESHTEMSLLVIGRDDFLRIFLQRDDNGRFQPEHFTFLR